MPRLPVVAVSRRRRVLAVALASAIAACLLPPAHAATAAESDRLPMVVAQGGTGGGTAGAAASAKPPAPAAKAPVSPGDRAKAASGTPDKYPTPDANPTPDSPDADEPSDATDADGARRGSVTVDGPRIEIRKGDHRIRVEGFGNDRQYDSFEQFVHDAPWLAGLVFLSVLLVFLVPLLIIVLLIWYKIRKARMHNETMLKLAERGVVPSAVTMDAMATGASASAAAPGPISGTGPMYDQARLLHRRAVWSDLRKGIILAALGFGLSAYSVFDDGTPNGAGLILLFLGLGYCVLWFFEDRGAAPRSDAGPPPGGGV